MSKEPAWLTYDQVIYWGRPWGRLMYANVTVDGDFGYGQRIARKLFWRFYWLYDMEENP